jgi:hypothetical protein
MRTINEALSAKLNGLHFGNRLILPFNVEILKVIIDADIIVDFSTKKKGAEYNSRKNFTELYFYDYKSLQDFVSEYENIKLVVVDDDKDLTDVKNHRKILVRLKENHIAEVEEASDDIIFVE